MMVGVGWRGGGEGGERVCGDGAACHLDTLVGTHAGRFWHPLCARTLCRPPCPPAPPDLPSRLRRPPASAALPLRLPALPCPRLTYRVDDVVHVWHVCGEGGWRDRRRRWPRRGWRWQVRAGGESSKQVVKRGGGTAGHRAAPRLIARVCVPLTRWCRGEVRTGALKSHWASPPGESSSEEGGRAVLRGRGTGPDVRWPVTAVLRTHRRRARPLPPATPHPICHCP